MFSQSGVDDTAIEENLRSVVDVLKTLQGLVEFIIVVVSERGDPRLDFLCKAKSEHLVVQTRPAPRSEPYLF